MPCKLRLKNALQPSQDHTP